MLLLGDISPRIELIDGALFLDRSGRGQTALRQEIAKHENIKTAQQWINMVPIDDFLDCTVSDWSIDDPLILEVVDVYRRSWLSTVKAQYGISDGLSVEVLKDESVGDVIVRLNQL